MKLRAIGAFLCVAVVWLFVAMRALPHKTANSDFGTFSNIAARLVAGDRMYVTVWDNKDPLFYYMQAVAYLVGPIGFYLLELAWLILASLAAVYIAKWCGLPGAMAIGFLLIPILLTGEYYIAGFTHLPGTSLGLAVIALALHRHVMPAGIALGMLLFLKITTWPVVAIAALIVLVKTGQLKGFGRAVAGMAIGAAVIILLLLARGELRGYWNALLSNVRYSDGDWTGSTLPAPLMHLQRVTTTASVAQSCVILLMSGLVIFLNHKRRPKVALLAVLALVSWIGALISLALTAFWWHHLQVMAIPACLTMLAVVAACRLPRKAVSCALIAVVALGLAGWPSPRPYAASITEFPHWLSDLVTPSAATKALNDANVTTVARLGSNGRGEFVGLRSVELACPVFHEYPFDPPERLAENLACVTKAPFVIVNIQDFTVSPGHPAWNSFIAAVEQQLQSGYECQDYSTFRLCRAI